MKPTVGRIVHYHNDGSASPPCAALITRVYKLGESGSCPMGFGALDGTVDLCVYDDCSTENGNYRTTRRIGVPYSPEPRHLHWSWPPRDPA